MNPTSWFPKRKSSASLSRVLAICKGGCGLEIYISGQKVKNANERILQKFTNEMEWLFSLSTVLVEAPTRANPITASYSSFIESSARANPITEFLSPCAYKERHSWSFENQSKRSSISRFFYAAGSKFKQIYYSSIWPSKQIALPCWPYRIELELLVFMGPYPNNHNILN